MTFGKTFFNQSTTSTLILIAFFVFLVLIMLGARTKQVFSYGRRGRRIVNVSERDDGGEQKAQVLDSDDTLLTKTIMKIPEQMRGNILFSPQPRSVIYKENVKKHLQVSPVHSSPKRTKKRAKARCSIGIARGKKTQAKANVVEERKDLPQSKSQVDANSTAPRLPLRTFHTNVAPPRAPPLPLSKAGTGQSRKKNSRLSTANGTPLNVKRTFSPFVDVDIIVLDDAGRRVSQERRVSRTDIQINLISSTSGSERAKGKLPVAKLDFERPGDSDEERTQPQRRAVKRPIKRAKPLIVLSDDSDIDEGPVNTFLETTQPSVTQIPKRSSMQVEVLVPPPPYQLPTTKPNVHQLSRPPPIFVPLSPTVARPRPLTPLRGGYGLVFSRHPVTPCPLAHEDSDLEDLSLELSQISITSSQYLDTLQKIPEYLIPLLDECGQTSPYEFSAFIESFPFDPIVRPTEFDDDTDVRFKKIGEASYSEVFGIGDVVLKVVPIRNEEDKAVHGDMETPAPSDAKDILKEMIVTRVVGDVCDGFVKLLRTYVVKGRYPSLLLDLWDEYNERKGSESIRPDSFSVSQVYAIIVLPNGGPDLEAFVFKDPTRTGWRQACSIFWQVARALAQAEELVSFEHRDLHWGQILVKTVPPKRTTSKRDNANMPMDDTCHGVKVTIIDLGLSRVTSDSTDNNGCQIYWTPFEKEIFEGEGDYQFDVYRMMKEYNADCWEDFKPFTNVMWLHYIALKLLHAKRLKPPTTPKVTMASSNLRWTEKMFYDVLVEIESLLSSYIHSVRKPSKKRTAASKTTINIVKSTKIYGLRSACDTIQYGIARNWLSLNRPIS